MGIKRVEWNVGPLQIPDVNAAIDDKSGGGELVRLARPPLNAIHRLKGLNGERGLSLFVSDVPHLDGLVPGPRGHIFPAWVPVKGKHGTIVTGYPPQKFCWAPRVPCLQEEDPGMRKRGSRAGKEITKPELCHSRTLWQKHIDQWAKTERP